MTCSDLREPERHWWQWTLVSLFALMLFASILLGCYAVVRNRTQRERVAANELQKMGATFDTWVGWEEVVLGTDYAPVVQVDLRGVRDIRAAVKHLDALSHIEDLNLSGTSIVDSDLEHFGHLSNLTSLDLSNTRVTDAGLDHLQGLENLRWLTLDKNEITDAGIERLRRRLPHIEVKRHQLRIIQINLGKVKVSGTLWERNDNRSSGSESVCSWPVMIPPGRARR